MTPLANRNDPWLSSHFYVEIGGVIQAGFQECSGLQVQTEVFEYKEGGQNEYVVKLPGRSSFANITLKWGMCDSHALWDWYEKVLTGSVERKSVSIVLYDSEQNEVRRWDLQNAFPVKWVGPGFNASTNAVSIETLELAYHGFHASQTG